MFIFQILRVLKGEPYSSITESSTESVAHVTDKMSSLRFISKDSGHGSMGISGLYSDVDCVSREWFDITTVKFDNESRI